MKDRLANKVDKRVFIRADARAKYGSVVDVVDNVRSAGVDDVGLLTEQKHETSTKKPPAGADYGRRLASRSSLWQWQLEGPSGPTADINVTPLIDVLLVLLIIFMVITPLTPKGLDALVPQPPKDKTAAAARATTAPSWCRFSKGPATSRRSRSTRTT